MPDGTMLLRFDGGTPRLLRWVDNAFVPAPPPAAASPLARRRHRCIACLPDGLLTVQRAEVGRARTRRQRLQAAQLQLLSLFPDTPGAHRELLLLPPGQDVLLAFLHPEGDTFLQTHAPLLDTADVWTTSCLLGWAAGRAAGLTHFCWPGDDGHWLVASPQVVTVAAGGEAEARARMRLLGREEDFTVLGWSDVMAGLLATPPAFLPPDLALRRQRSAATAPWRPVAAAALAVCLAGLLLTGAALYRRHAASLRLAAWDTAAHRLYDAVLPPGDPAPAAARHAALEALAAQHRGSDVEGIDLLRVLDQLSLHAPEDPEAMQLLRVQYAGGAGSMTLRVQQLAAVHALLDALARQELPVVLTLEHIEKRPADMLVSISLRAGS